ncbi:MAG: HyaD/HybD family hydrogenase maturation endopeptidase [Oscillochloridaceae bacterium]|nr:HyaD/HybD family hydrogenase maturation endopeptidase [Chloroflexaceae bacterium]MDW8390683.1 HyaD/HybD family hydrogenase maturation endopeptidase [Oscillochloridaceae bacterium]
MHLTPETAPSSALVLGLGNLLLSDEGIGVHVVQRLSQRYQVPEQVQILDGGTLGLGLLPYLQGVTHLLVIDAIEAGQPPGAVVRLEGEEIPAALAHKMSMHQVGLQELLALSQLSGDIPAHIVLIGVQPASLEPGLEPSPLIAALLDTLADRVAGELRAWGFELEGPTF